MSLVFRRKRRERERERVTWSYLWSLTPAKWVGKLSRVDCISHRFKLCKFWWRSHRSSFHSQHRTLATCWASAFSPLSSVVTLPFFLFLSRFFSLPPFSSYFIFFIFFYDYLTPGVCVWVCECVHPAFTVESRIRVWSSLLLSLSLSLSLSCSLALLLSLLLSSLWASQNWSKRLLQWERWPPSQAWRSSFPKSQSLFLLLLFVLS